MAKVLQVAEFFVVGGPVQPDRLCYVERAAERLLEGAVRARSYAAVLGPRAIGKSSLMGRVARKLRSNGELTVSLDLAQIGARGDNADQDRWSYAIAHRIAHELHLQADLMGWWEEKTAVARERRLADFFWEIVLTNTTAPVTVFIDEIEQTLDLPFADELFAALRECHARRAREPDFARLNFVVLGVESLRELARDSRLEHLQAIELADFTLEESYQLAVGFGGERAQAQALMDRVFAWTGGHPYLTQKIARGVVRKGGKLEDVERVVREQLTAPAAAQEDPVLSHARAVLTARAPAARRALRVLRRIAKGRKVAVPRDETVLDTLRQSGVATLESGTLRYRNRVFKETFGARWVRRAAPLGWPLWTAAAALVLGSAVLAGVWYTQYLPRPYLQTLTDTSADAAAAGEAYQRLRALPGFAARAEELYAAALARSGGGATALDAASASAAQLRTLPGREALADRLLADFWLRKAAVAAQAEQRDAALLFALRAAALHDAETAPRAVAELVGDDYGSLERSVHVSAPQLYWGVDWARTALLAIDGQMRVQRLPLRADGSDASAPLTVPLSALEHHALTRELRVEGDGSAGEFELVLALAHPATGELALTLTAPSGAQANVLVPQAEGDAATRVLAAADSPPLAALADEERGGTWRLAIVDRRAENAGTFGGWALRFGAQQWRDDVAEEIAIPEPTRTADVKLTAAGTALMIAQPATPGAIGTVALWDLASGRLANDFTLPAPPRWVDVNVTGTRLLAVAGNTLTLWNVADGMPVARVATQTEFLLPPVFSADGGYVVIAESVEDARPLYSLLRADDGTLLASIEGVTDAAAWLLGPGARYLAVLERSGGVLLLDPRRDTELGRLARDARRVLPLADDAALLTVEAGGEIRVWRLDALGTGSAGRLLGVAADADSVSVASADGARVAYVARGGDAVVVDVASGTELFAAPVDSGSETRSLRLSPDGSQLATRAGEQFRVWSVVARESDARSTGPDLSALGVDREQDVVALGFRGGELRVRAAAELDGAAVAQSALDFFGHRGAIASVAVAAARGVVATGGNDGTVRLWDLASAAPTGMSLLHTDAVAAVAISADGVWVAGGAEDSARVWRVADGTLAKEIVVTGSVSALAFSQDATRLAIGDTSGTVWIDSPAQGARPLALHARAAIASVAFAPDGERLASGDAAGEVRVWSVGAARLTAAAPSFGAPVGWVGFTPDGGVLLARTQRWLHSFAVRADALEPLHSRLAPLRFAASSAHAAAGGERVRLAGVDARGRLDFTTVDLAVPGAVSAAPEVLARDWPRSLGLYLNDAGEAVPLDP